MAATTLRVLPAFFSLALAGLLLVFDTWHPHPLTLVDLWLALFFITYLIAAAGLVGGKVWARWLCLATTLILVFMVFIVVVGLWFFSAWVTPDREALGFLLAASILSVIMLGLLIRVLISSKS